jgi:hypothetical protein
MCASLGAERAATSGHSSPGKGAQRTTFVQQGARVSENWAHLRSVHFLMQGAERLKELGPTKGAQEMRYGRGLSAFSLICLAACSPSGPDAEPEAPAAAAAAGSAPGEWLALFDGTDLARWNAIGDANWEIVDGAVRANSGNGFLVSDSSYADFDLELEFWVTPEANSGVFVRCMSPQEISAASCYEVNIYDLRPDPTYRTGAIVDVAAPARQLNTGGRWNSYAITLDGARLQVTLNDVRVVDVEDTKLASGPIALQYGAGTVTFRNVRVRPR